MSNSAAMRWWIVPGCLLLFACGAEAPPPPGPAPALPGVPEGSRDWSWRDVLARPLPGEAAPALELLALQPASARMDALAELAAAGDPRAPTTLMAALRDPQDAVAVEAARLLGHHGHRVAIPRLLLGLGPYPIDYDVPPAVRCAEAAALARLGNPAGLPFLLAVLAEGTPLELPEARLEFARTERVVWLQELALPGLAALAGTDFGYVPGAPVPARTAALRSAQAFHDARRLALWAAAPVDDPGLRARVALVLAHLGAYQLRQVDAARFLLAQLGPGALPLIEPALAAPGTYARVHALEVLERLAESCDPKARVRLANLAARPLLQDALPAVAVQAAAACGAARVADQLVVALGQRREPEVTVAVLDALGRTGLPVAARTLADFAADPRAATLAPDARVALEAARLATDRTHPAEAFLALLASEDTAIAFAALQRLVALTGEGFGLDPTAPAAARTEALAAAARALAAR